MVASGNSPASSHLRTLGAISRCANSRTLFLSCSCSSLSWKSKGILLLREGLLHHSGDKARNGRTDRLVRGYPQQAPEERHNLAQGVSPGSATRRGPVPEGRQKLFRAKLLGALPEY